MEQAPTQQNGKFFDWLGNIPWGDVFTAAVPGAIQTLGQYGVAQMNQGATRDTNAFTAQQSALEREASMARLQAQLASQQAIAAMGGGGGGGSAAAMENVKRQRLADMANTLLKGAELKQSALSNWLAGVQRPFAGG